MLRLSLRRWCAAVATASTPLASSSTTTTTITTGTSAGLPDFYGKNFTVSPRTWEQIHCKNTEEGFRNDARFLRLAIDSGGCHGYLYKFSFEPMSDFNSAEDVAITEEATVKAAAASVETSTGAQPSPCVVVDSLSVSKLDGATLDFHSELKGSAFVVVGNELVDQSCACAMSFSLKKKKANGPDAGQSTAGAGSSGESSAGKPLQGVSGSNARPITRRSAARPSS